jgi:uncharacterized protein (DUF924 family)
MPSDPPAIRPEREAREAAALRENLRKRKAQARERADAEPINEILDFWFLPLGHPERDDGMRKVWFQGGPAFDAEIATRFGKLVDAAGQGALDGWAASAPGALALIVVLDQFPRNMFRGQARAFATDAHAREIADGAVTDGFDRELRPIERPFMYLPFEHSEQIADQHRAVALFEALPPASWRDDVVQYAVRHRDAIARFGRFPARNAALGRESTPEEVEFVAKNPYGF